MRIRSLVRVGLLLGVVLALAGCARFVDGLRSHLPPDGTESARRLAPGPFEVEATDLSLVDESRPTMANEEFPGAPSRSLSATVWSPGGAPGDRPLVVYGHGFTGSRTEMQYLLEHLASHGYLVAAIDFPLTNREAPGGPNALDLASQPGDIRFTIDSLLEMNGNAPFPGRIDPERIGVAGLSYGGLTSTLVAFHEREADPRVKAVISVAGPSQMFLDGFFERSAPPFLMLAGTEDALVPFDANAAPLPSRGPRISLVSIEGGTHLGFVEFAKTFLRFHRNPDQAACDGMAERIDEDDGGFGTEEDPFGPLGGAEAGIDIAAWELPCQPDHAYGEALRPQRQQIGTALAVRAFFDSVLHEDASARSEAERFLRSTLAAELSELRFSSGPAPAR